jgi:prepilin-type N-terminal cleavage/methylation domain-containing protein
MKARTNQAHGFTLVEIMTVVVIVGILSAIAVPSLIHLKNKSEEAMVMNTLRQVYDAQEIYFTDTAKPGASLTILVEKGYASKSLAATVAHPPGHWSFSTLVYLKPGAAVSSTEVFVANKRVSYGRKLQYP